MKIKAVVLAFIFIITFNISFAYSSGEAPYVEVNSVTVVNDSGRISVSGFVSNGHGKRVTMTIFDPEGELVCLKQTVSASGGVFSFVNYLNQGDKSGEYTYRVKSTMIDTVKSGTFTVNFEDTFPTLTNVGIKGDFLTGETINASYMFFHMGGLDEGESLLKWYYSNSLDSEYLHIHGETSKTLVLTNAYAYKYIKFTVTPIAYNGVVGSEVESSPVYIIAQPTASNVTITATGNALYGNYDYFHPIGYEEIGSVYKWYLLAGINDTEGEVVGTAASYVPKGSETGRYICFEVTPRMEQEPSLGKSIRSAAHLIRAVQSSGSGSGGSGGGYSYTPNEQRVLAPISQEEIERFSLMFDDTAAHWAKDDIEVVARANIINGTDERMFEPDRTITRAEFTSMLSRMLEFEVTDYNGIFKDVSSGAWYAPLVETAYSNGLVTGYDGYFRGEDFITREEMCVIAVKALILKGVSSDESANLGVYEDYYKISQWAIEYIGIATQSGLVRGDGRFLNPHANATRAEAAVIVKRIYEKS